VADVADLATGFVRSAFVPVRSGIGGQRDNREDHYYSQQTLNCFLRPHLRHSG
jgi:hypothetical protein